MVSVIEGREDLLLALDADDVTGDQVQPCDRRLGLGELAIDERVGAAAGNQQPARHVSATEDLQPVEELDAHPADDLP